MMPDPPCPLRDSIVLDTTWGPSDEPQTTGQTTGPSPMRLVARASRRSSGVLRRLYSTVPGRVAEHSRGRGLCEQVVSESNGSFKSL